MRKWHIAMMIGAAGMAAAQYHDLKAEELLGKTESGVLAIGFQKWYDAFIEKHGESTMSMCDATVIFGQVLANRNNRLLDARSKSTQTKIRSLRASMRKFGEHMCLMGGTLTGGGTMWHPIIAHISIDAEETLYGVLTGIGNVAKPHVVSSVDEELTKALRTLRTHKSSIESYAALGYSYEEGLANFRSAKSHFVKIVQIAKTMPRGMSDRLLAYCADYANVPAEMAPDGSP